MKIRHMMDHDDRTAISRIYEESWRAAYRGIVPQEYLDGIPEGNWNSFFDTAGIETLLMLDGCRFIGTASYCQSRFGQAGNVGEVVSIYLLPRYMGKGCGKMLFRAVIDELEKMGYDEISLWVLEENRRAREFYEKMGFHSSGQYMVDSIGGKAVKEIQYCRRIREKGGGSD